MAATNKNLPVIFLAFANDHQAYLYKLTEEQDGIRDGLDRAESNGLCKVVYETDTDIVKIFKVFDKYQDRIAVFHYGGHAEDFTLLLKESSGKRQYAHSEGLMEFLGQQKGLKFVFINGCCSKQQAELLRDKGVPAVIGTSQPIDDAAATILSTQFYESLAAGRTLDQAWKAAEAKVKTLTDVSSGYRAIGSVEKEEKEARISFPWELYIRSGAEDVRQWNLPRAAKNPLHSLPLPDKYYKKLPPAPFPGLHYFTKESAAIFFGRGVQIRELYNHISGIHPIILLYGKSGVGKSSLLGAGLLPRIEDRYTVIYVRRVQELGLMGTLNDALDEVLSTAESAAEGESPGRRKEVLDILKTASEKALEKNVQQEIDVLIARLLSTSTAKVKALSGILKKWQSLETQRGKPLLVILDQVEEKFTRPMPGVGGAEDELTIFLEAIHPLFAIEDSGIDGKLILSYRKEYHPEIRDTFHAMELPYAEVFIKRLDRDGIMEAISGVRQHHVTRKKYRLEIEDSSEGDLVEIIADDLLVDPESPIAPVLQIILKKLWENALKALGETVVFSVDDYHQLRKEGTSMEEFFQQQMEKMAGLQKKAVESGLVLDLLYSHTTPMGTAGSCRQEDLFERYKVSNSVLSKLLQQLQDLALLNRIYAPDENSGDRHRNYTTILAHDTLARAVINEYNVSDKPGPRAARILKNKLSSIVFTAGPASLEKLKVVGVAEKMLQEIQKPAVGIAKFRAALAQGLSEEQFQYFIDGMIEEAELNFKPGKNEIVLANADLAAVERGALKTPGMRKLTRPEEILLANSRARRKQRLRRRKQIMIGGMVMLLAIIAAATIAWLTDEKARENAARARLQKALNHWNNSRQLLEEERDLEFLHITADAVKSMGSEANKNLATNILLDAKELYRNLSPVYKMVEHTSSLRGARFHKNESALLTWGDDNTVRSWNMKNTSEAFVLKHNAPVRGAVFNGNESRIFTWGDDTSAYLWEAKDGSKQRSFAHKDTVKGAQFHPDGDRILTWSDENVARLWTVTDGSQAESLMHLNTIRGAKFNRDGSLVLTWSDDNTAALWDVKDNPERVASLPHGDDVSGACFNSDETLILTWSKDRTVRVWNTSGQERTSVKIKHDAAVMGAQFDRSSSRILTWSQDKTARLWNASNGRQIIPAMAHGGWVKRAQFDHNESNILTYDDNNTIRLWNAEDGKQRGADMKHESWVVEAKFYQNSSRILSWGSKTARLWDAATGKQIGASMRHEGEIRGALLNRDETRIVTWGRSNAVWIWGAHQGHDSTMTMTHKDIIRGAQFNDNDSLILTWSDDNTARIWDAKNRKPIDMNMQHDGPVRGAQFSADDSRILTWGDDHTVRLWDVGTGRQVGGDLTHTDTVRGALFSADANDILTWGDDHTAHLWDVKRNFHKKIMKHEGAIKGASFNHNESLILTWSDDHTVCLWDRDKTDQHIGKFEHKGAVVGATFNKDTTSIAILSWGKDNMVRLWDVQKNTSIKMAHIRAVTGAQFNGDGSLILSWSDDNTARLWDAKNGKQKGVSMTHEDDVRGAVFNPDGNVILAWSSKTARLWDANTGEQIGNSMRHGDWVFGARFSKDGGRILTWSKDGTARLWDAVSGEQIGADMQHADWVLGAAFGAAEDIVLTWSKDSTARLWDISFDRDFPLENHALQLTVLTGTTYDVDKKSIEFLNKSDWQRHWVDYKKLAKSHNDTCNYPQRNQFRRFFPDGIESVQSPEE